MPDGRWFRRGAPRGRAAVLVACSLPHGSLMATGAYRLVLAALACLSIPHAINAPSRSCDRRNSGEGGCGRHGTWSGSFWGSPS